MRRRKATSDMDAELNWTGTFLRGRIGYLPSYERPRRGWGASD
jgi:hypothetical protein